MVEKDGIEYLGIWQDKEKRYWTLDQNYYEGWDDTDNWFVDENAACWKEVIYILMGGIQYWIKS